MEENLDQQQLSETQVLSKQQIHKDSQKPPLFQQRLAVPQSTMALHLKIDSDSCPLSKVDHSNRNSLSQNRPSHLSGASTSSSKPGSNNNQNIAISVKNGNFKGTKTPNISSKYWAIFDVNKMNLLHGKREYQKREIASLTKIMTCFLVIQLSKQWNLNINKTKIFVSDVASDIRGTTANLKTGDLLSIEKLLYALMLPSGNDAAFALAQYFGYKLWLKKYGPADVSKIKSFQFDYHPYYAKYFLKEMNIYCLRYGLSQTQFDSPHGLQNIENLSTASDMAKLSAICMQNEVFKRIVSTKYYECEIRQVKNITEILKSIAMTQSNGQLPQISQEILYDQYIQFHEKYQLQVKGKTICEFVHRKITWENTNFLLSHPGYNGLKTGITEAAGPCLSASYQKDGHFLIIILLKCKSMEARWNEVSVLVDWAKKILNDLKMSHTQNQSIRYQQNHQSQECGQKRKENFLSQNRYFSNQFKESVKNNQILTCNSNSNLDQQNVRESQFSAVAVRNGLEVCGFQNNIKFNGNTNIIIQNQKQIRNESMDCSRISKWNFQMPVIIQNNQQTIKNGTNYGNIFQINDSENNYRSLR